MTAGPTTGGAPGRAPVAVLLLGPHRCGTSCMTHLIHEAGFHAGRDVLGPHVCNARGLWENGAVVAFNERLLSGIGAMWCDPAPVSLRECLAPDAPEREALATLLRDQYPVDRDIVIKDPRVSRLAPLYIRVLHDLGYRVRLAIALRHPGESADSLYRRDGIPRGVGYALWAGHVLAALEAAAGGDARIIAYDDLVSGRRAPVQALAAWLCEGREPSAGLLDALAACIDPSLRHSRAGDFPAGGRMPVRDLAEQVHDRLARAAAVPPGADEVRAWQVRYRGLVDPAGWSRKPHRLVLYDAPGAVDPVFSDALSVSLDAPEAGIVLVRDGGGEDASGRAVEEAAAAGRLGLFYNREDRGEAASLARGLSLCGRRGALLLRRGALVHMPLWLDWLGEQAAGAVVSWRPARGRAEDDGPQALFLPGAVVARLDPWPHVAKGPRALDSLIRELGDTGVPVVDAGTLPGHE